MGGRDRKVISRLCYQYFRLGHYGKNMLVFEKIILAAQIFPEQNQDFLDAVLPEQAQHDERVEKLKSNQEWEQVFSFHHLLSEQVDKAAYGASMLQQPHLFLRIRPGCEKRVTKLFDEEEIPYQLIGDNCLQVPNGTAVNTIAALDKWLVVQDRSSQQTGEIIWQANLYKPAQAFSMWDCCAASGGKSMMLTNLFENISITVSDIRESILQNLKQRYRTAGITQYHAFVGDISSQLKSVPNAPFDMVLADVPCTGSGTWSRTPEQLYYFKPESLQAFADRQLTIASNASRWLKVNGYLVYITCSVFAAENEMVVEQLMEKQKLLLVKMCYIPGYTHGADSMFMAILQKQ